MEVKDRATDERPQWQSRRPRQPRHQRHLSSIPGRPAEPDGKKVLSAYYEGHRVVAREARARLGRLVDIDRLGLWEGNGFNSLRAWVSATEGISGWAAERHIKAAYALEKLPVIAAALEAGALSLDKTCELTRFATPEDERKLVTWAKRVSPKAIRQRADKAMKARPEDAKEAFDARFFRMWDRHDGTMAIEGLVPLAEGIKIKKALDRVVDSLPSMPDEDGVTPDEDTTLEQKRADALAALASVSIANDQNPDLATIVAYFDMDALKDGTYAADLEGGYGLHPSTLERLSCDCRLQPVATGVDGNMGIGMTSRVIPRWLRRKLMKRDGGRCAFPGCCKTERLSPHHMQHWIRLGPTDEENLAMLCPEHHVLMHEGRWSMVIDRHGTPTVFRPSGRIYEVGVPGVDEEAERLSALADKTFAARTLPTWAEEKFGITNTDIKEFAQKMASDTYEIAKYLAGV